MKTLFLLNPNAGRPRDLAAVEELISSASRAVGFDHEIVLSPTREGVAGIIEEGKRNGIELICAVGGDGTVHEVGCQLIGTEIPLAIIPLGSGNGLARHLGIPCDVEDAMKTFDEYRIETIDTGMIDGRPFLGICGIGLDAAVAHRFATSDGRGLRTYLTEGLITWSSSRATRYTVVIEGSERPHDAYLIAFANSGQYGNEARVAPLASLQDGLIDICILHDASLARAPSLLYRLFTGSFHESGSVTTYQAREVRIEQEGASPGHIDGDPAELPATFDVRIRDRSLNVLVPHKVGRI